MNNMHNTPTDVNDPRETTTQTPAAVPPPFTRLDDSSPLPHPNEATPVHTEQAANEAAAQSVANVLEALHGEQLTQELLRLLKLGISHDADVAAADAEGYVRGKNEHIAAVVTPETTTPTEALQPVVPVVRHRSIWD